MRLQCPNCKGIVSIDDSSAGQPVGCGHCGNATIVPQTRFSPTAVIDDFVIIKELGLGGMGRVYLAHQISLDRPIALKILKDQFSTDSEFILDFVNEARSAARLNHPNIVQAYAVGEEDGVFFLAMEFVKGQTLKQIMEADGPIPVDRSLVILRQIGNALDFAWKNQKLVHRDIKPDNIMLNEEDVAKLADLGLARVASELTGDDSDDIMGTPQYICPEQLLGESMDIRGDIYSLGATFYHVMTGQFPFDGTSATDIARKHLQAPVPEAHLISPDIPESVSAVLIKMMQKKKEDRYRDAADFVLNLERIISERNPGSGSGTSAAAQAPPAPVAAQPAPAQSITPEATGPQPIVVQAHGQSEEQSHVTEVTSAPKGKKGGKRKMRVGGKATGTSRRMRGGAATGATRTRSARPTGTGAATAEQTSSAPAKSGGIAKVIVVVMIVAILAVVGALGVGWMALNKKYAPETGPGLIALYFSSSYSRTDEHKAYQSLKDILSTAPPGLDLKTLEAHTGELQKFIEDFDQSLFSLEPRAPISYRKMFELPIFLDGHFAKKIATLVDDSRGEVLATWQNYEEILVAKHRKLAHEQWKADVKERVAQADKAKRLVAEKEKFEEKFTTHLASVIEKGEKAERDNTTNHEKLDEEKAAVCDKIAALGTRFHIKELFVKLKGMGIADKNFTRNNIHLNNLLAGGLMSVMELEIKERDGRLPEFRGVFRLYYNELRKTHDVDSVKLRLRKLIQEETTFFNDRTEWFKQYTNALTLGKRYYEIVAESGDKLKGRAIRAQRFPIQYRARYGKRFSSAKVNRISLGVCHVEIYAWDRAIEKNILAEIVAIPLAELDILTFRGFARAAAKRMDREDYATMEGAFLFFSGHLDEAEKILKASTKPEIKLLLAELNVVRPKFKKAADEVEIDRYLKRVLQKIDKDQMDDAKRAFKWLEGKFGGNPHFEKKSPPVKKRLSL